MHKAERQMRERIETELALFAKTGLQYSIDDADVRTIVRLRSGSENTTYSYHKLFKDNPGARKAILTGIKREIHRIGGDLPDRYGANGVLKADTRLGRAPAISVRAPSSATPCSQSRQSPQPKGDQPMSVQPAHDKNRAHNGSGARPRSRAGNFGVHLQEALGTLDDTKGCPDAIAAEMASARQERTSPSTAPAPASVAALSTPSAFASPAPPAPARHAPAASSEDMSADMAPGSKKSRNLLSHSELVKATILMMENGKRDTLSADDPAANGRPLPIFTYHDGWSDERVRDEVRKDFPAIKIAEIRRQNFGQTPDEIDKLRSAATESAVKHGDAAPLIRRMSAQIDELKAQVKAQGERLAVLEDLLIASPASGV